MRTTTDGEMPAARRGGAEATANTASNQHCCRSSGKGVEVRWSAEDAARWAPGMGPGACVLLVYCRVSINDFCRAARRVSHVIPA